MCVDLNSAMTAVRDLAVVAALRWALLTVGQWITQRGAGALRDPAEQYFVPRPGRHPMSDTPALADMVL
jgi:hypothetical protein